MKVEVQVLPICPSCKGYMWIPAYLRVWECPMCKRRYEIPKMELKEIVETKNQLMINEIYEKQGK